VPALPDVPGVIRCEVDFLVGSDAAALTRWYMAYSGAPFVPGSCAGFAGNLISEAGTILASMMHSDTSVTEARVTDLSSATGDAGSSSTTTAGTRSGAALPASAAVLLNATVGRRWRGGKPRGYWPLGTATDLLTRQTWESASQAAFLSALETVVTHLSGEANGGSVIGAPVNVSYYGPPNRTLTGSTGRVRTVSTVRAIPLVDAITGYGVNVHVASQRRRDLIRS
jgi:hypothetical protein